MSRTQEKIKCPSGFGEVTRGECHECEYRTVEVCPVGTAFVRDYPMDRSVYEPYLVREWASDQIVVLGEPVCCPECKGEHFTLRRVTLSDRMLASARMDVVCVNCGYRESLYEIGGQG